MKKLITKEQIKKRLQQASKRLSEAEDPIVIQRITNRIDMLKAKLLEPTDEVEIEFEIPDKAKHNARLLEEKKRLQDKIKEIDKQIVK